MMTQDIVCRHAVGTIAEMRLHSGDVWLHAAPMFHLVDAFAVYAITAVGGTHVLQPVFDASATLHLMQQEGVTVLNMAGTVTVSLFSIPRLVGGRCLHWAATTPFSYRPPLSHVIDTRFKPSFLE